MTLQIRTAVRRVVAASIVAAAVLTAATACTAGSHVEISVPAQTKAAFPDDVQAQMQSAVEFAMAATGSTGAVVGVWAPWSGTWVAGLGEGSTDDVFRTAQVTRAMTCDALYRVAASGALSLDDPIKKYVSSIAGIPDQITLRELCNGTSGLGSYSSRLAGDFVRTPGRVWNPNELAAYGAGAFDPARTGTAWHDSDAGYVLLGLALERVTGRPAAQILREQVFTPLNLAGTKLPADAPAAPGSPALTGTVSLPVEGGVNCAAPTDVTVMSASSGFTDSGVVSTIDDLGRYAQALASNALVPADAGRFSNPLPVGGDQPSWFTATGGAFQAGSLIGQFGSVPGYITAAFAEPTTGMAVAVVLNNSAASPRVGAYLAWQLAAIASKAPAAPGQTAPAAGLPWTAAQFHDQIAGLAVCPLPAP